MYMLNKYQPLEQKLYHSSPAMEYVAGIDQRLNSYYKQSSKESVTEYKPKKVEYEKVSGTEQKENMIHSSFLKPNRPEARFIGNLEEVQHLVLEAFRKLMGSELPNNIIMALCTRDELENIYKKVSKCQWSNGIQGFAINNPLLSRIFIKENPLDLLMLTIGHEIGHILTPHLGDQAKEEAKAFAFELAWAKILVENNIGNLKSSIDINPNPAKNGIHDKGFEIVSSMLKKNKTAIEVYEELISSSMNLASIIGKGAYGLI